MSFSDSQLQFLSQWTGNYNIGDVRDHVSRTWISVVADFHAYQCIEKFKFLTPRITTHFRFESLAQFLRLCENEFKLADIGCCFGQETRFLISQGFSSSNFFALDVHDGYWKAGLRFFQDCPISAQGKLHGVKTCFGDFAGEEIPSNDETGDMTSLFDCVVCLSVLHVLTRAQSEQMLKNTFKML